MASDEVGGGLETDVRDGAILELTTAAIPSYDAWVASFEPFLAAEYAASGLIAELERHPVASIVTRSEYERLEAALAAGRCLQLVYASGGLRISGFIVHPPRINSPRPTIIYARGGNRDFGAIGPLALLDFHALTGAGYIVIASQYRGGPDSRGSRRVRRR